MQLLHPFATLLAKSKLLVLPVYPAAWPQAKQHPIVQRFFQFCRYFMSLDVVQKVRYRYQQAERGAAVVAASVERAAARIGLADRFSAPTHGYEATREAATAAFAKSWRKQ